MRPASRLLLGGLLLSAAAALRAQVRFNRLYRARKDPGRRLWPPVVPHPDWTEFPPAWTGFPPLVMRYRQTARFTLPPDAALVGAWRRAAWWLGVAVAFLVGIIARPTAQQRSTVRAFGRRPARARAGPRRADGDASGVGDPASLGTGKGSGGVSRQ